MTDDDTDREDGALGGRDPFDDDGQTCDRCGGAAVPDRSGTAPILECADCGNVLGLADAGFDSGTGTDRQIRTDEVTATDGELAQLVTLLRSAGTDADGTGPSISTDRIGDPRGPGRRRRRGDQSGRSGRRLNASRRVATWRAFSRGETSRNLPVVWCLTPDQPA